MKYKIIDLNSYPRRSHFEYFSSMSNPYVGVTVEVDITDFLRTVKRTKSPFFLSFLYCVVRAANSVSELRQRILNGQPIEYDHCLSSHTVMREDGTYRYCCLDCMQDFDKYMAVAVPLHEKAKYNENLEEGEDPLNHFFVSCIPWIHYSDLTQPTPSPADSNVRIVWGKYTENDKSRVSIPVTLLANHALVDGIHLARFYDELNVQLGTLTDILSALNPIPSSLTQPF